MPIFDEVFDRIVGIKAGNPVDSVASEDRAKVDLAIERFDQRAMDDLNLRWSGFRWGFGFVPLRWCRVERAAPNSGP